MLDIHADPCPRAQGAAAMPEDAAQPDRAAGGAPPRGLAQELVISAVLRGGVLLSAAIIALGTAAFFWQAFTGHVAGEAAFPHTLGATLAGVRAGNPAAIIVLGLLVLLATPLLRIIVSIVSFARERDWPYVAITLLVLAILLLSFALGKGGA
jgi:uncharacterized membrane protein